MKVIITKRFKKEYYKKFKKYFSLKDFSESLSLKYHKYINLVSPFFKLKQKLDGVNFRTIVFIVKDDEIVPLIIALKKDKNLGENLNWRKNQILIKDEYKFALEDIENGDFEIYENLKRSKN